MKESVKKIVKKTGFIFVFFALLLFSSCTVKIDLTLQDDGSVDIAFNGGAGAAFTKMVLSASGGEEAFNVKEIAEELKKSGFTNVKASANGISDIQISMKDSKCSSFIFTSGLLSCSGNTLVLNPNRKALKDFYSKADEQVQMILDLFLAPVFNDEDMSEDEYIDLLGTFYGAAAGKEVKESSVEFTIKNSKGNKTSVSYSMAELMCSH